MWILGVGFIGDVSLVLNLSMGWARMLTAMEPQQNVRSIQPCINLTHAHMNGPSSIIKHLKTLELHLISHLVHPGLLYPVLGFLGLLFWRSITSVPTNPCRASAGWSRWTAVSAAPNSVLAYPGRGHLVPTTPSFIALRPHNFGFKQRKLMLDPDECGGDPSNNFSSLNSVKICVVGDSEKCVRP